MTEQQETWVEVSRVCRRLGLSDSSVRRLMANNDLRWRKIGPRKGYQVALSSVICYEEARQEAARLVV
ncbi:MAG: hypothetical protein OEV73_00420 [Desulfobulbaceae bacterium]|nr:hypothetical protein [Desulfobulbaceae bacterium]